MEEKKKFPLKEFMGFLEEGAKNGDFFKKLKVKENANAFLTATSHYKKDFLLLIEKAHFIQSDEETIKKLIESYKEAENDMKPVDEKMEELFKQFY